MFRGDRDRIEEIRAKSGADIVQVGMEPGYIPGTSGTAEREQPQVLGADFRSPWQRDRVSLSMEAQLSMIEMRGSYRLTLADLGYTNKINVQEIRPGIFCKIEPTGCYRMGYNDRQAG